VGILLVALASVALAHDTITTKLLWTREISRIINKHCASCHREGGAAMSLANYDDARPWAKAIRDEVASRRMPPWGPVKGVGEFRDDPSLSQIEIDMIVNWVEGGAPKGDDIFLPAAPHFAAGAKEQPAGRALTVTTAAAWTVAETTELAGVRPLRVAAGDSFEVTAYEPDGAVAHLIWIRGWRPLWQRTYYFRHPVTLPKSTQVSIDSGKAAEASLIMKKYGMDSRRR
jgi:hypothetical protein